MSWITNKTSHEDEYADDYVTIVNLTKNRYDAFILTHSPDEAKETEPTDASAQSDNTLITSSKLIPVDRPPNTDELISLDGQVTIGNGNKARLQFMANNYMSYFELYFRFEYVHPITQKIKTDRCALRLNHRSFTTMLKSETLTESTVKTLFPEVPFQDKDEYFVIKLLDIDWDEAAAENLWIWTDTPGGFDNVRNLLAGDSEDLHLLIRGSAQALIDFDNLYAQFNYERENGNFAAYFKHSPANHFVQVGAGAHVKRSERPVIELNPRYSFFNLDDYTIQYGYGALDEGEIQREKATALTNDTFEVRIVPYSAVQRSVSRLPANSKGIRHSPS